MFSSALLQALAKLLFLKEKSTRAVNELYVLTIGLSLTHISVMPNKWAVATACWFDISIFTYSTWSLHNNTLNTICQQVRFAAELLFVFI